MGKRVITFITKSSLSNLSMNALIMGKPHWGDMTHLHLRQHCLCCLGRTLLFFDFIPFVNFKPEIYARFPYVLTMLCSLTLPSGVCRPHSALRPAQLSDFCPLPTAPPPHGQWGRIPEQGGQATSEPFPSSHLLLWISASTVCWVHTYIVSNLHKTLLGWDHPALICGQKFKDYIISQALSATGFELRSC